jgi:DnaK suppressor protein
MPSPRNPDGPNAAPRRKVPKGGPRKPELRRLRDRLLAMRAQLLRSNRELAEEALNSGGQDFSVDHMADHGTDHFDQDFTLSLLQGESELLAAITAALERIDGLRDPPYGMCEICAEDDPARWEATPGAPWIPLGRLEVVPYATLCVPHQERTEEA